MVRVLSLLMFAALAVSGESLAERWWKHVTFLADDRLEGRETGTPGHRLAVVYAASELKKAGLKPAANGSWYQKVPFETRVIDEAGTSLTLVSGGEETKLTLGKEAYVNVRMMPKAAVRAPLVFAGYGLRVPEMGWDDLEGLDLKGKIAVVITGAPKGWPGPLSAHVQNAEVRWEGLRQAGAVGLISIARVQTTPWVRASAARLRPQMSAVLGKDNDEKDAEIQVVFNPEHAEMLFSGTGHAFADLLKSALASEKLPRFALGKELAATTRVTTGTVVSENVVGLLPGRKKEYVVVSAHIDHTGMTRSFTGDGIFNGAMDNASGVAAAIEVARLLKARKKKLERGVLVVLVTGEEKGLQGSRYFARKPTVPRNQLIADCNMDMFLPIHKLEALTILGVDESTLGDMARATAATFGLPVYPDPIPEQNRFTRSDQYSFIREGTPALAFKFGYKPGSAEEQMQADWLKNRYHAVSDDLAQPVDREAAARFTEYLAALVERTANAPRRPAWKPGSFFRRFAKTQ